MFAVGSFLLFIVCVAELRSDNGYERSPKKVNSRCFALIPSRSIRQMLANFSGVEF